MTNILLQAISWWEPLNTNKNKGKRAILLGTFAFLYSLSAQSIEITLCGDSTLTENHGLWIKKIAQNWADSQGYTINYIDRPESAEESLALYEKDWTQTQHIDVYFIDVVWVGIAEPYALDLSPYFTPEELRDFLPSSIENCRTPSQKLVALPFFVEGGLLYSRSDLLQKYGYSQAPRTWLELESMAQTIQAGERKAGNPEFWGYVWQGAAYEGLTCNAIEWIVSQSGEAPSLEDLETPLKNPTIVQTLQQVQAWIGTISPPEILEWTEFKSLEVWKSGNSAFMRHWPTAYQISQKKTSAVAGKIEIGSLPQGKGVSGKSASTLGGWQLMVGKHSRSPLQAVELVRYLTSEKIQNLHSKLSFLPSRTALYQETDFLQKMYPLLQNTVPRPSTKAGKSYVHYSHSFYTQIHDFLLQKPNRFSPLLALALALVLFLLLLRFYSPRKHL